MSSRFAMNAVTSTTLRPGVSWANPIEIDTHNDMVLYKIHEHPLTADYTDESDDSDDSDSSALSPFPMDCRAPTPSSSFLSECSEYSDTESLAPFDSDEYVDKNMQVGIDTEIPCDDCYSYYSVCGCNKSVSFVPEPVRRLCYVCNSEACWCGPNVDDQDPHTFAPGAPPTPAPSPFRPGTPASLPDLDSDAQDPEEALWVANLLRWNEAQREGPTVMNAGEDLQNDDLDSAADLALSPVVSYAPQGQSNAPLMGHDPRRVCLIYVVSTPFYTTVRYGQHETTYRH